MARWIPRPLRAVCNCYALLVVLVSACVGSALQFCAFVLVFLPRSQRMAAAQAIAHLWWATLKFLLTVYEGVPLVWYGEKLRGECAIALCNHRTDLDFVASMVILSYADGVGSRVIPLMKNVLKLTPPGWICYFTGAFFLKRNWEKDKAYMNTHVRDVVRSIPRPFYIGIFPEGTRITDKKKQASHAFAEKFNKANPDATPLPLLDNCLIPRKKGLQFFVQNEHVRSCVRAVYDCTMGYSGGDLWLSQFMRGGLNPRASIHIHARRHDIEEVTGGSDSKGDGKRDDVKEFLIKSFKEKDTRLGHLVKNGRYPEPRIKGQIEAPEGAMRQRILFAAWGYGVTKAVGWALGTAWPVFAKAYFAPFGLTCVALVVLESLGGPRVVENAKGE